MAEADLFEKEVTEMANSEEEGDLGDPEWKVDHKAETEVNVKEMDDKRMRSVSRNVRLK